MRIAIQTYQMYQMIFLIKVILIKIEIFHAFVLARNPSITVLMINQFILYKKYRSQSNQLLKIFLLSRKNLFLFKMLLSLFNVSNVDFYIS